MPPAQPLSEDLFAPLKRLFITGGQGTLPIPVARELHALGMIHVSGVHWPQGGGELPVCRLTKKGKAKLGVWAVHGKIVAIEDDVVVARLDFDPSAVPGQDYLPRRTPATLRKPGLRFVADWFDGCVYDPRPQEC